MKTLSAILTLFLLTTSVWAATIYVDDDGPADFNNIQAAVNVAENNDVIIVLPGTYDQQYNNIYISNKSITLQSTNPNDPCIVNNTIITANNRGACMACDSGPSNSLITIKGLYIADGNSSEGGGIICRGNTTIENCVFRGNSDLGFLSSMYAGGAISYKPRPDNSNNLVISNCTFIENSSGYGGAITCSKFLSGIYTGITITVSNCTFINNSAELGGAICFWPENYEIIDVPDDPDGDDIYTDSYRDTDSITTGSISTQFQTNMVISNCDFIGNSLKFNKTIMGSGSAINCSNMRTPIDAIKLIVSNCKFDKNFAHIERFLNLPSETESWYSAAVVFNNVTAVFTDCAFTNNNFTNVMKKASAYAGRGGALTCYYSPLKIDNCIFTNNYGVFGGGVFCFTPSSIGETVISNSLFSGNYAAIAGAMALDSRFAQVRNCTFVQNSAQYVGGLYCDDYVNINNSIFSNNTARAAKDETVRLLWTGSFLNIKDGNEITIGDSLANISYCNVDANQVIKHGDFANVNWGLGNIDVDPCFVDAGYWDYNDTPDDPNDDVWFDGDYHLLPVSLCINSGDPNFVPAPGETDLDGLPRVIGGRVDMGCYESDAIKVPLNLSPKAVNIKSFGCFITAFITLPKDITPADIDKNDPLLFLPGNIESKHQFIWQSGFGKFRRTYIMAVFSKSDCMQYLKTGQNEVTIIGQLKSGQFYFGKDRLLIIPWRPFFWWR